MEIGKVIRKYRKEKNLTQEEVASRLGVTPPAVNKWENGNSYPDISLLMPIARLLGVSLDTLLGFQSELSKEEILDIVSQADRKLREESYEEGLTMIRRTLAQYPNCGWLSWQLAVLLNAHRFVDGVPEPEQYDEYILELYLRALESSDEELRRSAADSLYQFYLRREEYEEAEQYLVYYSAQEPERKRKQAALFQKMGRTQEAYQAYEELVFAQASMTGAILHALCQMAMEEKDWEQAHYYVEKMTQFARAFEMGTYAEVCGGLELAVAERDTEGIKAVTEQILESVGTIGAFAQSKLYRHMKFRGMKEGFAEELRENLVRSFRDEEAYGFMKEDEEWRRLLKRWE